MGVAGLIIVTLPGCGDLEMPDVQIPGTSSESKETPAANSGTEVAQNESAGQPEPPAPQMTPGEIIDQVLAKPGMEITDADLARLAGLESDLEKITELNLEQASVTGAAFDSMAVFPSLKKLNLAGSLLTAGHWPGIEQLGGLESLNISRTSINNDTTTHIGKLTGLKELNLSQTSVTDDGLAPLSTLAELTELRVGGTRINGSGLQAFGNKGARAPLKILDVGSTNAGYQGFIAIKEFRSLEELYAMAATVTDGSMQGLKGLSKLRILDISGGNVSDGGLTNLSSAKQLEELILDGNRGISDNAMKRLRSYKKLTKLSINDTFCTYDAVTFMKKAIPDCKIYFDNKEY